MKIFHIRLFNKVRNKTIMSLIVEAEDKHQAKQQLAQYLKLEVRETRDYLYLKPQR
jgi:hypothetical protein